MRVGVDLWVHSCMSVFCSRSGGSEFDVEIYFHIWCLNVPMKLKSQTKVHKLDFSFLY